MHLTWVGTDHIFTMSITSHMLWDRILGRQFDRRLEPSAICYSQLLADFTDNNTLKIHKNTMKHENSSLFMNSILYGKIRQEKGLWIAWSKRIESFVKLMSKNSICRRYGCSLCSFQNFLLLLCSFQNFLLSLCSFLNFPLSLCSLQNFLLHEIIM